MGNAVKKEAPDQYRVLFGELAKVKRGEPVQIDPYLIARAIVTVMGECTVRSAAGRSILWNDYRMILARRDFDLVRPLQGPLERDLRGVLEHEAQTRQAELVGELRITVVFDEGDELPVGQGVVRVGFVPTDQLAKPRPGEMTMRFDSWVVSGEIAARAPVPTGGETQFVADTAATGGCLVTWPGGEVPLAVGATVVLGRPHEPAPAAFVALAGATAKVNKQQIWIGVGSERVRIGRLPNANPVHVNGQPLAAAQDVEIAMPAEISLSHGDCVLTVRRR
ncbi:MAG TPA: FhaA domain-containing protein [Kofleriaceae bacterium]|nr:FhaA domain-containing protein [Kofleriaceae bacterium]